MTIWEWGLFAGAAVIALQIMTSLMSYYHRLYRQEYLIEYLERQQRNPLTHDESSNASDVAESPVTEQQPTRNAA